MTNLKQLGQITLAALIFTAVFYMVMIPLCYGEDGFFCYGDSELCIERFAKENVEIDMHRIMMIESSGNPNAVNKSEGSTGLYQISPITLKEWNNLKPCAPDNVCFDTKPHELFDPDINYKIANWYLNKRIPQMIKYFKLPDTIEGRLIAYNAGIGNYKKYIEGKRSLPPITKRYLRKYKRMGKK